MFMQVGSDFVLPLTFKWISSLLIKQASQQPIPNGKNILIVSISQPRELSQLGEGSLYGLSPVYQDWS